MADAQLSDYVRQQKEQGRSKEEIKNDLLSVGWQEAEVDQALSTLNSSQIPRPPRHCDKYPEVHDGILRNRAKDLLGRYLRDPQDEFWQQNRDNPLVHLCIDE